MTAKYSEPFPLSDEEEARIQKLIAFDPDAPEATDDTTLSGLHRLSLLDDS